jgi:hypothetical protein
MESQSMDWAGANPNAPRLGIGQALVKPIGSAQAIITDFKFAGFDVNCDNLALVVLLNLRPDFGLVEGISPLGKFFFAISGLSDCHGLGLTATSLLYFSLADRGWG